METAQIAPTILVALGLDPEKLDAVRVEGTQVLPGLDLDFGNSDHQRDEETRALPIERPLSAAADGWRTRSAKQAASFATSAAPWH